MKHMIRDSFISAVCVLGLPRLLLSKAQPRVRVLCFHDVPDRAWFTRVIDTLIAKTHVISPEAFHTSQFVNDKINVLITFDDGYRSWVDVCAPVLKEKRVKGLFFISSGLLGAAEQGTADTFMRERLLIRPREPLTWDGVRTLVAEGHSLGGHTVSHARLAEEPETKQIQEITEDKHTIETRAGVALQDFAYPFGARGDRTHTTARAVHASGYTFMFAAEPGFVTDLTKDIPRTLIEDEQSPQSVMRWVEGGYDIFYRSKGLVGG